MAEHVCCINSAPDVLPTAAAEIMTVEPTPLAAADCRAAKRLPCATRGMVDCHEEANEFARTPPAEHPRMYMRAGSTVAAAVAPATPPPTSNTAAHCGVTLTTSGGSITSRLPSSGRER